MWHYSQMGSGRPLILLHGIGMSRAAWNPVLPLLSATRSVIAFDIAGFGSTPPLADGARPTIANLVDGLARSVHEMGIETPVDIAGSSLGGCMALEAARRGIARRVVAISPCCLWKVHGALHVDYVFASLRFMATRVPYILKMVMRAPLLREVALAVPLSVGSRRMPLADARRAIDDLAASTAFEQTFDNTRAPFSAREITIPVTVAFGRHDWILTRGSRYRHALPPHTRWVEMPRWGHVPMWVDPAGVSDLVLKGTYS